MIQFEGHTPIGIGIGSLHAPFVANFVSSFIWSKYLWFLRIGYEHDSHEP
jgi:hypothetical protein